MSSTSRVRVFACGVVLAGIVLLTGAAPAPGAAATDMRVPMTTQDGWMTEWITQGPDQDARNPAIRGGVVTWESLAADRRGIYYYRLDTRTVGQATTGPGFWNPRTGGGRIVYDQVVDQYSYPWSFRVSDGFWLHLGGDTGHAATPQTDGALAVWRRGAVSPSEQNPYSYIYWYEFATDQTGFLTLEPLYIYLNPTVDSTPRTLAGTPAITSPKGWVAFIKVTGAMYDVMLYDLSNRSLSRLNASPYSSAADLDFRDGKVAWTGGVANARDVFVFDMATGVTKRLTDHPSNIDHVRISGNRVVWYAHDGHDFEIFLADVTTGYTVQLTDNDVGDVSPDVDGDHVVWAQDPPGGGRDIVMATLSASYFSDIDATHPYWPAVEQLRLAGVLGGYQVRDHWEFRPGDQVLRAQFAKMIVGTLGLYPTEGMPVPFTDLGPNDPTTLYPHEYAATAAAHDITNGTAPGLFSPWQNITRAQVVTMIVRAALRLHPETCLELPPRYQSALGDFDPIHGPAMALAEYSGFLAGLQGYGPAWDPWKPATRGEVAQMLWQFWLKMGAER